MMWSLGMLLNAGITLHFGDGAEPGGNYSG